MTPHTLSEIWTAVPPERRRRLIALLSQVTARLVTVLPTTEEKLYDGINTAIRRREQQASGPSPGPSGCGLWPTVDTPATRTPPGVDAPAIRARRARAGLRLGVTAGAGD